MSYQSDHEKYGDFFNNYSPNRQRSTQNRRPTQNNRPPKRKKRRLKPGVKFGLGVIAIGLVVLVIILSVSKCSDKKSDDNEKTQNTPSETTSTVNTTPEDKINRPQSTDYTVTLGDQIESLHAVLVDSSNDTILARRNADKQMYPASMTKVMTLLVAAENITDYNQTFKMTSKIIDPVYRLDLTLAGFCPNEEVKLIDMMYGMTLESGAEAAVGLAVHVAGSEEEFVKLMNQKCKELGLTSTNFTNVSGQHDKNHYTTAIEMAMIMKAAIKNPLCREILSTEYYTVLKNEFHDELKFHSGMFEKMHGNEPEVATVKGGKTGFTAQSLFCLVSFAVTDDGREIICVTAEGERKYSPIYDCIELYKEYTHPVKGDS